MTSPVVLHLTRPYASADEYLEREGWSIDTRSMVLVGQAELPAETDVVFDVTLADGSKPIRAEARVVGVVAATEGRPAGLRVRFRRYGSATRAFVERAVSSRGSSDVAASSRGPASVPPAPGSVRPAAPSVAPPAPSNGEPASVPPPASNSSPPLRPSVMPAWEEDKTSRFTRAVALAMPMTHEPTEVAAPSNRDALLERLRKRAKEGAG
ncbi:MAG TPA: hypothetical protein VFZ53_22845 [Polyangiaceae bacterium]